MIKILNSKMRGHANHGWLDTHHSFSFADYYNPEYMGFHQIRVINEDRIQPKQGFPSHSHRDMEIISFPITGSLKHEDNTGNGSTITSGEIQRMSAGTGITHSEYNASDSEPVHFYQIWIYPKHKNIEPDYEQKSYQHRLVPGELCLVASADGRDDSVVIHQDVDLYTARMDTKQKLHFEIKERHNVWLQLISGSATIDGKSVRESDGVEVSNEQELSIFSDYKAAFLLFDLGPTE
ncbi:pirin family protein [Pseudomonadota bacterium]